jgi:hypothetical protein
VFILFRVWLGHFSPHLFPFRQFTNNCYWVAILIFFPPFRCLIATTSIHRLYFPDYKIRRSAFTSILRIIHRSIDCNIIHDLKIRLTASDFLFSSWGGSLCTPGPRRQSSGALTGQRLNNQGNAIDVPLRRKVFSLKGKDKKKNKAIEPQRKPTGQSIHSP